MSFVVLLQMYNDFDLTIGHIPSKPALFATQQLSMLFSNEELQTSTIEPSEKSGKQKLDPHRITLLFGMQTYPSIYSSQRKLEPFYALGIIVVLDVLNKVYGESKIKKTMNLINQAIKQKCLDKVKQKRRSQELSKN